MKLLAASTLVTKLLVNRLSFAALMAALSLNAVASEPEWTLGFGMHDIQVENSDTFGGHVLVAVDYLTQGEILLHGNIDTYIDADKDGLDPDHIPLWFQTWYYGRGNLLALSPRLNLDWQVELKAKRNTVSSVELQYNLYPSLLLNYGDDGSGYDRSGGNDSRGANNSTGGHDSVGATLKTGAGYFFLEIDDDVPKQLGYQRGEFANDGLAWMVDGSVWLRPAPRWKLSGGAEYWADGSGTLEYRYYGALNVQTPYLYPGTEVHVSVEQTHYMLDVYSKGEGFAPILPWDSDTLYRLYLTLPW